MNFAYLGYFGDISAVSLCVRAKSLGGCVRHTDLPFPRVTICESPPRDATLVFTTTGTSRHSRKKVLGVRRVSSGSLGETREGSDASSREEAPGSALAPALERGCLARSAFKEKLPAG